MYPVKRLMLFNVAEANFCLQEEVFYCDVFLQVRSALTVKILFPSLLLPKQMAAKLKHFVQFGLYRDMRFLMHFPGPVVLFLRR